ncbi:hypothetical protein A0H81_03423 [Grifola frondosa]|uniref:Uncharacterized protein n=1 Tax=Grifola frondosa TaxID=5627 RepID=A0A1C7MJE7_GRIFR|nr:hypothetical protein A0H81_03423 [Grifola frondosa]
MEWATSLHFDWRLLRISRMEWSWPTVLYILCRLTALATVVSLFVELNLTSEFDCMAMTHTVVGFGYIAVGFSSALIALRVIGIWGPFIPVILIVGAAFLANMGLYSIGIIQNGGSQWSPSAKVCLDLDTTRNSVNVVISFATDAIMLFIMLLGIWHHRGGGSLWQVVKHQGVIWLIVAVLFYIPAVAMVTLNLNGKRGELGPFVLPGCTEDSTNMHIQTNTINTTEPPIHFAAGINTSNSESEGSSGTLNIMPVEDVYDDVDFYNTKPMESDETMKAAELCAEV